MNLNQISKENNAIFQSDNLIFKIDANNNHIFCSVKFYIGNIKKIFKN